MLWLVFALLWKLFWAISNILEKYTVDKISKWAYDYLFYSAIFELLFSFVIYMFFDVSFSVLAIISGILLVSAIFFYVKALEDAELSAVIPLFETIPIFVLIISYVVFGKTITDTQFLAFVIILLGWIIVSTNFSYLKKLKVDKSFFLMLFASFLYALVFSISDFVVWNTNVATVAFWEWIWFFIWTLFFFFLKKSREEIISWIKDFSWKKFYLFWFSNSFDKLWMITTYKAFSLVSNPALVSVLWWIQAFLVLVFTSILSVFYPNIIKENIETKIIIQKIIWIVFIFIGIYILYMF